MRVVPAAPSAVLMLDDAPGHFAERRNALNAPRLRQRLALGPGQLAGFGQRDEPDGAEAELAAVSADDDPRNAVAKLEVEESPARNECRTTDPALTPAIA